MGADPRSSRRRVTLSLFVALAAGTASLVACSSESSRRDADAQLLPLPGQLGGGAAGRRQLHRGQHGAVQDQVPEAAERRRRPAPADGPPARRARTRRSTSSASTSRGPRSSPRPAGSGSGRATTRPQVDRRHPRRAAARRRPTRTSSTRLRTTATPSCSGTAPTSCRTPPKTWDEMIDMASDLAKRGQAALHRDPGQPVRGHHRLVQHAARQRGRQRPQRRRPPRPRSGRPRSRR